MKYQIENVQNIVDKAFEKLQQKIKEYPLENDTLYIVRINGADITFKKESTPIFITDGAREEQVYAYRWTVKSIEIHREQIEASETVYRNIQLNGIEHVTVGFNARVYTVPVELAERIKQMYASNEAYIPAGNDRIPSKKYKEFAEELKGYPYETVAAYKKRKDKEKRLLSGSWDENVVINE